MSRIVYLPIEQTISELLLRNSHWKRGVVHTSLVHTQIKPNDKWTSLHQDSLSSRGLTFQNWHSFETFSPDQVLMLSKLSQFPLYFCYFLVDVLNFLLSALKLKIVFKFARTNLEMSKFRIRLWSLWTGFVTFASRIMPPNMSLVTVTCHLEMSVNGILQYDGEL